MQHLLKLDSVNGHRIYPLAAWLFMELNVENGKCVLVETMVAFGVNNGCLWRTMVACGKHDITASYLHCEPEKNRVGGTITRLKYVGVRLSPRKKIYIWGVRLSPRKTW